MDAHKYASPADNTHEGARAALMDEVLRTQSDDPQKTLARVAEPSLQDRLGPFSASAIIQRISDESKAWGWSVRTAIERGEFCPERLHGFRSEFQVAVDALRALQVSDEDVAPILDIAARIDIAAKTLDATQPGTPERRLAEEQAETVCLQAAADESPAFAALLSKVIKGYQIQATEAQTEARTLKEQVAPPPTKPPKKSRPAKIQAEAQARGTRRHYLQRELYGAIDQAGGIDNATPSLVFQAMEALAGTDDYAIIKCDRVDNSLVYFHRGLGKEKKLTLDAIKCYMERQRDKASKNKQRMLLASHGRGKHRSVA